MKPIVLLMLAATLVLVGCNNLPAGDVARVRHASDTGRIGNVYLMRGWLGLYSSGIDRLAEELQMDDIRASVFRAEQWRDLNDAIVKTYRSNKQAEPLVLVGFSYGADDAVGIARDLNDHYIRVDLLITIDPVTPDRVPPNVKHCINYYQTNGAWDSLPWFRGVPLKPDAGARVMNIDLRKDRTDLLEADTSHQTISNNPKLHDAIVADIIAVCSRRHPTSGPAGTHADGSIPSP